MKASYRRDGRQGDRGETGDALHHQPGQHAAMGPGPARLQLLHRGNPCFPLVNTIFSLTVIGLGQLDG